MRESPLRKLRERALADCLCTDPDEATSDKERDGERESLAADTRAIPDLYGSLPPTASEKDPHGTDQHAPGAKLDAGKPPLYFRLQALWPTVRWAYLSDKPTETFSEADDLFAGYPASEHALQWMSREAFDEIAVVAEHGARKYTLHGWQSVPNGVSRYLDAAARHYWAALNGEEIDPDFGCRHIAHARWNVLAAAYLEARQESERRVEPLSEVEAEWLDFFANSPVEADS